MEDTLQNYAKQIEHDYCLMSDKNGVLQPYDIGQQMLLSWDYLHTHSRLREDAEPFKAYIKRRLTVCANSIFSPSKSKYVSFNQTQYLNTFKTYTPKTENNECKPFHELMSRMFPVDTERKIVTQFIAHALRHPEQRPTYGLLLTGTTSTGKGTLYQSVLAPLLANQVASARSFEQVLGKHSELLNGTLLVILDDIKSGNANTYIKLKSVMTEPTILINPKYLLEKTVKVYSRIIFNSNEKLPLPIAEDDRRWFATQPMQHSVSKQETTQFIKTFKEWVNNESNLDAIFNYLMSVDLADFNAYQCEQTPTLLSMMEQSTPSLELVLQDFIDNGNQVFKRDELTTYLNKQRVFPADAALNEALTKLDYVKQRILSNTHSVYMPSNYNKKTITQWPLPVSF